MFLGRNLNGDTVCKIGPGIDVVRIASFLICLLALPIGAFADTQDKELRDDLAAQRALVQQQMQMLRAQQATIESLSRRLDALEGSAPLIDIPVASSNVAPGQGVANAPPAVVVDKMLERDSEGDLNRRSAEVQAGDLEGTFKIPGRDNISLSIGGFAKTIVYANSDAENQGAIFLPGLLGLERDDPKGDFSVNANLSRTYLSAAAPVETGWVRAYLEYDFNKGNRDSADFNLRHAYASYSGKYGEFLAGQFWSTAMDLKVLPEALTDPTMSGAMFARQAQVRYSLPFGSKYTLHMAIEDPDSNDVFSEEPTNNLTSQPDYILGLEYDEPGSWHVRLNGILRELEVELPSGQRVNDEGWGLALTGSLRLLEHDKLAVGATYGEGLGRYLLGLAPGAAAVIDPASRSLKVRDNWGGFTVYSHQWQPGLRSAAILGYAEAGIEDFQPGSAFSNTTYAGANLLWSPLPYLTLGIEYVYGDLENEDGSGQDDHRLLFGAQIF